MHFNQLGNGKLPVKLTLVWSRISFSRLTFVYFVFSVLHFIIQLSLQIKAFTTNNAAAQFLSSIVDDAHTTNNSLPFLSSSGCTLRLCEWVPMDVSVDSCPIIWQASNSNVTAIKPVGSTSFVYTTSAKTFASVSTAAVSTTSATSIPAATSTSLGSLQSSTGQPSLIHAQETVTVFVTPQATGTVDSFAAKQEDTKPIVNNVGKQTIEIQRLHGRDQLEISAFQDAEQVKVNISGDGHSSATLDSTCLWALNWPVSVLDNTKREDIVFIAFQFWVLGMSIVALMNESIPHIFASLLTHMMATAWAGFQISHTANFRANFAQVITNGACKGTSLLPHYWDARRNAEIPSLALNVFALLISCVLTWRLIKLFGWQTFKRVGASLTINRVYKIVLSFSIAIQLSLFFMAVTVSLWLDQLFNSVIGDLAQFQTLYKTSSFITLALLLPWLMSGWFAARRELRLPMFFFLMLSILYLTAWGVMFFSTTFRWTFVTWQFFSVMATASVFLTLTATILGVICRFNFGKGLLRYLSAQQYLPGDDAMGYYGGSDIEKVAFPSNEKPIPTYSAAFGSGPEVPVPSYMFATRGPRFYNPVAEPFEPVRGVDNSINSPPAALTRHTSNFQSHIQRSSSHGSSRSSEGLESMMSHTRSDSQQSEKKRWVIE